MQKLIAAYKADRSVKNAVKLYNYSEKHPMSCCFLSLEDQDYLAEARSKAKREG